MIWLLIIVTGFLGGSATTSTRTIFSGECENQGSETVYVIEGEALLWPCPNLECSNETDATLVSWFRNGSDGIQRITKEENSRVHQHNSSLYILPLSLNDTGHYLTQWYYEMECYVVESVIKVYKEFHTDQLYDNFSEQSEVVSMSCPVCDSRTMSLEKVWYTWYKDFHLIPGETEKMLRVYDTTQDTDGIYTCVCTFEHNGKHYNSSGSYKLHIKEHTLSFPPRIILPSNNSVMLVDLGSEVVLKCSVFFGINMREQCNIFWERNRTRLDGVEGYTYHTREVNDMFLSVLTISKVSVDDLQTEFRCLAKNPYEWLYVLITLKTRDSVLPLVLWFLCTFLFFLLVLSAAKWFAVDLALLLRGSWIMQRKRDDGKVYDAYVIYQKECVDETTQHVLTRFISKVLPAVLEETCGYELYIHGRDDLPGEDCMELTEQRLRLSRRLMVVLTPEVRRGQNTPYPQGYDWQVGLHQALVEGEMSVILIQLDDMSDYSHLPLGLQHLLWKTRPLKWDATSSPSSRFWKRVRYMMPVPPARPRTPDMSPTDPPGPQEQYNQIY